ncbi:apoptotic enhancer 1 protein [Eurytemora carolleeae]|uniref:apoptotic enhancer 1 protein n=1 Tax=Eurytemora carolleeae TaxID=1294199 RepID=UPI000C780C4A|nr:apoptotic enhancer 1 protein [Eurytemora carolleeae]|eukprot:XP_023328445.1 apoptotic enhancer 1 protein-like [Eurytemora affinis]
MLKFARKRSSSTDRELMRNRTSPHPSRPRSSSAERSSGFVTTLRNELVESPVQVTKSETRAVSSTAPIRRIDLCENRTMRNQISEKRNSVLMSSKATLAPMTNTLSQLVSQVQISETGDTCKPPPVLPRKPKVENFLQHYTGHLWKVELLDTSGESGYGTDNSDNNSLRSQDSVEPIPPPLPRRKPRRRVQFDSYVLLMQALKERDIKGIMSTIFNVSAEALCTEDVVYYFHTAILRQDYEMTDLLVRAGCEVNTFDHRGWSALHCACSVARLDMIKLLLQNGAAVLARTHHSSQTGSQLLPQDNPAFPQCLAYLRCMEECLGTVNSRIALAAANYRACRVDELSISKGDRLTVLRRGDVNNEMWWWMKNARGEDGYVLRDLLALNSRFT